MADIVTDAEKALMDLGRIQGLTEAAAICRASCDMVQRGRVRACNYADHAHWCPHCQDADAIERRAKETT